MEQDKGAPTQKKVKGKSLGQRWEALQPTKTLLFWSCLITAVVVMIIGFNWGGWMTGGSAQDMSEDMAEEAVVARLAPMCVVQFLLDPAKAEKLVELKDMSNYSRGSYIEKQGWATMSGEEKPDRKVASECAKLIMLIPEVVPTPEAETMSPPAETTPASE
jgi:hypothetical protein